MTKKDYEKIAQAIAEASREQLGLINDNVPAEIAARFMRGAIIANIADVLAADNPRFDGQRFMVACLGFGD